MEMANTLAYCDTATMTAVKMFIYGMPLIKLVNLKDIVDKSSFLGLNCSAQKRKILIKILILINWNFNQTFLNFLQEVKKCILIKKSGDSGIFSYLDRAPRHTAE
jgi:hypothetical protein